MDGYFCNHDPDGAVCEPCSDIRPGYSCDDLNLNNDMGTSECKSKCEGTSTSTKYYDNNSKPL